MNGQSVGIARADWELLRDAIVSRVFSAIDTVNVAMPEGTNSSMKSVAKKAIIDHVKSELGKEDVRASIGDAIVALLEDRLSKQSDRLAHELASVRQREERYGEMLDQFQKADVVTSRALALQAWIERMLPMPDYDDSYVEQQALRSRGLVMAAACGMTTYGYGQPPKSKSSVASDDGG